MKMMAMIGVAPTVLAWTPPTPHFRGGLPRPAHLRKRDGALASFFREGGGVPSVEDGGPRLPRGRAGGARRQRRRPFPNDAGANTALLVVSFVAATVAAVLATDALTMRFEAVQEWRYGWPMIGALYVLAGLRGVGGEWLGSRLASFTSAARAPNLARSPGSGDPLPHRADELRLDTMIDKIIPSTNNPIITFVVSVLSLGAGLGVLAGGYIDAFFPVWVSSPDPFGMRSGLESDSASILLLLTIASSVSALKSVAAAAAETDAAAMEAANAELETAELSILRGSGQGEQANNISLGARALTPTLLGGFSLSLLCAQLWEMSAATFYAWGENLHLISS